MHTVWALIEDLANQKGKSFLLLLLLFWASWFNWWCILQDSKKEQREEAAFNEEESSRKPGPGMEKNREREEGGRSWAAREPMEGAQSWTTKAPPGSIGRSQLPLPVKETVPHWKLSTELGMAVCDLSLGKTDPFGCRRVMGRFWDRGYLRPDAERLEVWGVAVRESGGDLAPDENGSLGVQRWNSSVCSKETEATSDIWNMNITEGTYSKLLIVLMRSSEDGLEERNRSARPHSPVGGLWPQKHP